MSLVDIHIQSDNLSTKNDYFDELNVQLADNDHIQSRCGEIFISHRKVLVFVCTECKENFFGYEDFFQHLNEQHLSSDEELPYEQYEDEFITDEPSVEHFIEMVDDTQEDEDDKEIIESIPDDMQEEDKEFHKELMHTFETLEEYDNALEEPEDYEPDSYAESCSGSVFESTDPPVNRTTHANSQSMPKVSQEVANRSPSPISECDVISPLSTPTPIFLFSCPSCPEKFCLEFDLKNHVKIHEATRKYKCEICGFRFTLISNLRAHVRRHIGEKQFACDECDKRFWTTTELNTHRRIHTGERPFICDFCGNGFKTSGALTDHEKRHTQKKRHKCSECDRSFLHLQVLREHMNTHTLDRPFVCKVCNATFSRKHSLSQHMSLHSAEKKYVCDVCFKDFAQKPGLLAHKKLHTIN